MTTLITLNADDAEKALKLLANQNTIQEEQKKADIMKRALKMKNDLQSDINKIATTQEETIVWHKYPDEMPSAFGVYLVDHYAKVICLWLDLKWDGKVNDSEVRAWAHLPEGWQE